MKKSSLLLGLFLLVFASFVYASEINATEADGLMSYVPTAPGTTIDYRFWNFATANFDSATTDTQSFTDPIEWTVLRANHERDEFILGTLTSGTIRCATYIYNGTGWGNFNELTTTCGDNAARRPLAIAYEQVSGDALILYENSTASDSLLAYSIWNGSEYDSNNSGLNTGVSSILRQVVAVPRSFSDDIMILGVTDSATLFAVRWDGDSFETVNTITSTISDVTSFRAFDFEWEYQSGWGLVGYGENNANVDLKTYDPINKVWSGAVSGAINVGAEEPTKIRMCSDTESDYIGIITQDSGNDVSVRIWDGNTNESSPGPPTEDTSTEANAISAINIDCAWNSTGGAIFMFVDAAKANDDQIAYVTYDQIAWSVSDLGSATLSPQVSSANKDLENLRIDKNPTNDELIVIAIDSARDLNNIFYNESWTVPSPNVLDVNLECLDDTDCGQFAWSQYDTMPNSSTNEPASGANFAASTTVNISVNVTDNVLVGAVLANITLPNGTIDQITLSNITGSANATYNSTFTNTGITGTFTIRIIANDTSAHNNVNDSFTYTFVIGNSINPNVTALLPVNSTVFNVNDIIEIAANVTDDGFVDNVTANVTYPNGTVDELTLSNLTYSNKFNISFVAPALLGSFNVTFYVNDTAGFVNSSEKTNFTVNDNLAPNVTALLPQNSTVFNAGDPIEVAVNVTDYIDIDLVQANVTDSSGVSVDLLTLSNSTFAEKFNISYTVPSTAGNYNITFRANDTSNNLNNSEVTNFTINDPTALVVSIVGCIPDPGNLTQSIICNSTVVDDIGVDSVNVTVTLPNSTNETLTVTNTSGDFSFTFTNSALNGTYNVSWTANDTDNNIQTNTTSFEVLDSFPPEITINEPLNGTNSSSTTMSFNFTAVDNFDTSFSCSLVIDGVTAQTNSTTLNDTKTEFIETGISSGVTHYWNTTCLDSNSNSNTSAQRFFIVDTTDPVFVSLTTVPSSADELDPNNQINLTANVTDNLAGVQTVILQYNSTADTSFTNLTMSINDTALTYNATFTPTQEGNYSFRVWANDTAGNLNVSNYITRVIELDNTWTRDPVEFASVGGDADEAVHVGNVTINNTGDYDLNFTMSSDYTDTFFNQSFPIQINSGQDAKIEVNATLASVEGVTAVSLKINSTNLSSIPSELNTNFSLVVTSNAFLSATITTAPTNVTRGNTMELTAQVDNIGQKNASNVYLFFEIPSEWTVTSGDLNISIGVLNIDDIPETNTIEVSVPTDAPLGFQTIVANTTGENESGTDLGGLGNILGDSSQIHVDAVVAELGAGGGVGGGDSGGAAGGGLGGGDSGGGPVTRFAGTEIIETFEEFRIVRGTSQTIPVKVTNPFTNSVLTDVTLELQGFLSQYVKISPVLLSNIRFNESQEFKLTIEAPAYLNQSEYELTAVIRGSLRAINPTLAGFTRKAFEETRSIKLFIHAVGISDTNSTLSSAHQAIEDMSTAGFPISRVALMYKTALEQFELNNFETAFGLANLILKIKEEAFEADALIKEIQEDIEKSKSRWLDVPETERALTLALKAFEREDFTTALQRAKDAQLTYILETKGRINILWFLKTYWWAILLGIVVLSLSSFFTYKKLIVSIITQRLKNLAKEEISLNSLMEDVQFKYLKEGSISSAEYHGVIGQYESRLNKIHQIRAKLRNKRIGIMRTEQEVENLHREEKEVISIIKKEQKDYLELGKLSRKKFLEKYESDKRRLAEVEEEMELAKEKLEREKISKKYKFLNFVNNLFLKIKKIFGKKPEESISIDEIERTIKESGIRRETIKSDRKQLEQKPEEKTLKEHRKESNKRAKRMSKEELKKQFPGAFK